MNTSAPETPSTDLSLLERVRDRDDDAWERFVELYAPVVLYWCRRQGLTAPDREDVFQEVSRALLTGLRDFRKDEEQHQFRRYLWAVTYSKIQDLRRRAEPAKQLDVAGWGEFDRRLQALEEEERVGRAASEIVLLRQILKQVATRLANRQSMEVLERLVIDGWSTADAARHFDITENAVRRTRARLLQMIRAEYREFFPPT